MTPGATDTGFAELGGATRSLVFNAPLTHQGPDAIATAGLEGMLAGAASVSPPFADLLSRLYTDLIIPHMPSRVVVFIATLFWRDAFELPLVGGLFPPMTRAEEQLLQKQKAL